MKRYIPCVLVFVSVLLLLVASADSSGKGSIATASLVGLAGIIILVVGVVWQDCIDAAAEALKQAAICREKIIAQRREELRRHLREAQK